MKFTKVYIALSLLLLMASAMPALSQLTVAPNQTAAVLAAKITGPGIAISAPTLTCKNAANATFVSSGGPLGIDSGILLTTGKSIAASGSEPVLASTNNSTAGDAALNALAGAATHDACILEFDFIPAGDSISFNYQFGSEEYTNSVCGIYNDAFAFFISGPGITGTQNMALIPGTTVPVAVNSVNNGIPGSGSGTNIANCTVMGPGSPFTSYYIDNTGGTFVTYKGLTTVFKAVHAVLPCNAYHLKITIADAGNGLYDSGVFIEAGSLKTNSFSFDRSDSVGHTIASAPNAIVKGCSPATVKIKTGHPLTSPLTLHLIFGGTALSATDFLASADSISLATGDSTGSVTITGLPTAPSGTKTLTVYLFSPYSCGIVDSIKLNILDSPSANMLTPDTSVCPGQPLLLRTSGTAGLAYSWSPAATLSSATVAQPTASPVTTTTYTMTATLPLSGCAAISRSVTVVMNTISISMLTPDTSICVGQAVKIRLAGADSLDYLWSPVAGVDTITAKQPLISPPATTTYMVTATSHAGCIITAGVTIAVVPIAGQIINPDTAICRGGSVQIMTTADPAIHAQWLPTAGIPLSAIMNTRITPDTSATYYLTGSLPGCTAILDSIKIDVQPNPEVYLGGNRAVCTADTIHIHASINPAWYTHYILHWSPAVSVDDTTAVTIFYKPGDSTRLVLHVTTPAGCHGVDSINITLHTIAHHPLPDVSLCPGDSVLLTSLGGMAAYHWHPALYISDTASGTPTLRAITSQRYTLVSTSAYGCRDTSSFTATVHPASVIDLGPSVTIMPGEAVQLSAHTNALTISWFPPAGLDNATIANPVAAPEISTRYIAQVINEWGCTATDSVNIYVDNETTLVLPNVFAPGSGPNGIFRIIKKGDAVLNYFRVFNRWGNMVYESHDISGGWDGSYNGAPQPTGVYMYEVSAVTAAGRVFQKHGNVTLIH